MRAGTRTFGAVLAHDVVCLVEYHREPGGARIVGQWVNHERSASIDEALGRLLTLLSARGAFRPKLSIAIEHFGVFHHVMTLPDAKDEVLQSIVKREVERLFHVSDPVVSFTRGAKHERREPSRADARTAPTQLFIGGAPRETIDALRSRVAAEDVDIEIATVVPKAIHSLYEATGASLDPTAVLVCFEGGPHLAFFLDGRLELAIDPPIAVEGERASIPVVLDQVERGAVYFRQQFRGATATQMLLSSRSSEYGTLSAALEEKLGVAVAPLFAGANSPEAVVAMGAVLESNSVKPLDIYPHPPTLIERARAALRGPSALVAGLAAAAVIAGIWTTVQFWSLASTRRENDALRTAIRSSTTSVESMRAVAEQRADYAHQVDFVNATRAERTALTAALRAVAEHAPIGVRFDSMSVVRAASTWTASIAGEASGITAAEAVRSLDTFYQSFRGTPNVVSASLDEFDYPAPSAVDSSRNVVVPVRIRFLLSFAIARTSDGASR